MVPYAPTRVRTRPLHTIRALAQLGHRVTVATLWTSRHELEEVEALKSEVDSVLVERQSALQSMFNCIRSLAASEPMQSRYSWNGRFFRRLVQELSSRPYDVVHVEHLRGARYGLELERTLAAGGGPRPAVVWDSVDCISLLFSQAARGSISWSTRLITGMELPATRRFEANATTRFRKVLVTSDADREALLALSQGPSSSPAGIAPSHVEVLPNGVDLKYFSPEDSQKTANSIVFSGKMSYHANAGAASALVRRIMPLVWAEVPEAKLWIVGKDPGPAVRRLVREDPGIAAGGDTRITVTGAVDDLRPYIQQATLAVAPLPYAVGIQNKVLEAMACGIPVVATLAACRAIRAQPGRDILTAATEQEVAAEIVRLLRDEPLRRRVASAGRRFVESSHDWRVIAEKLTDVYREVPAA